MRSIATIVVLAVAALIDVTLAGRDVADERARVVLDEDAAVGRRDGHDLHRQISVAPRDQGKTRFRPERLEQAWAGRAA